MDGAPAWARIIVVGVCMEVDRFEPFFGIAKQLKQFVLGYTAAEFAESLQRIAEGKIDSAPPLDFGDIVSEVSEFQSTRLRYAVAEMKGSACGNRVTVELDLVEQAFTLGQAATGRTMAAGVFPLGPICTIVRGRPACRM